MEASGTATVIAALTSAGGSLMTKIPIVAGIAIAVGLLAFGIEYLVHTFKKTAH